MRSVMWKFYLPITISARQFFDFLTLICDFQHRLFLLTLIISDIDSLNCGLYVFIEEKTLHTKYFFCRINRGCVFFTFLKTLIRVLIHFTLFVIL